MTERTALEIADRLKEIYYGKTGHEAAAMLRQQHAEIARIRGQRDRLRKALAGFVRGLDEVESLNADLAVIKKRDAFAYGAMINAMQTLIDIRPEDE